MNPKTDFSIRSFKGGYDKNFTYLITCFRTGTHTFVDAAVDLNVIKPFIKNRPKAILITHSHGDHIAFLNQYLKEYPDLVIVGHPETDNSIFDGKYQKILDGQSFSLGAIGGKALHTPGHYFDCISYHMESVLFTGDTLFVGRTGRVINAKSDIKALYESVYKIILALPQNTRIYPGHDYGKTPTITIRENISISPLLQAKNFEDFKNIMHHYEKTRSPE
ncbi:MAG: hypothetical protein CMG04_03600 [Candidatus Marinimicrobia bacterium]|nr:hypothetical protein [Candidatus Neomarinimicrobiota bacterium]|tara:strand:+ start:13 stop:672 length:660 start_codon:yes stop_codon:yes gene_type:complete